jgi:hypothetical protein
MKNTYYGFNIRNEIDINTARLAMVKDGRYPLGMTDCEVVGITGQCGPDCQVLIAGNCSDWRHASEEEK